MLSHHEIEVLLRNPLVPLSTPSPSFIADLIVVVDGQDSSILQDLNLPVAWILFRHDVKEVDVLIQDLIKDCSIPNLLLSNPLDNLDLSFHLNEQDEHVDVVSWSEPEELVRLFQVLLDMLSGYNEHIELSLQELGRHR